MPHNYLRAGKRHVEETRSISRNLIEKSMFMRCSSYLADVKAQLLTQTIFEIDRSKKDLSRLNRKLKRSHNNLARQVDVRTKALTESEERLKKAGQIGHIGTWDRNPNSGELIWTDEVYRILGFPPVKLRLHMNCSSI